MSPEDKREVKKLLRDSLSITAKVDMEGWIVIKLFVGSHEVSQALISPRDLER